MRYASPSPSTSTCHVGFRCVVRVKPEKSETSAGA